MSPGSLLERLCALGEQAQLKQLAVSIEDLGSDFRLSHHGDQPLHAASTFKAALLLVLLKEAAAGSLRLEDQLQVRNRFLSAADGSVYRIDRERDGESETHRHVGRSLSLRRLAHAAITRSSNLATNLLIDILTVARVQETLSAAGVDGLTIRRGVEDMASHEKGVNNEATADSLVALFRHFVAGDFLPPEFREEGVRILLAQEFNSMIPARLPSGTRVAHKTGEISTHAHDAGIIFPVNRAPYLLAIMTEWEPQQEPRPKLISEISAAIYAHLVGGEQ